MKRKLLIALGALVFFIGVWGTLTRKSPVESRVGYVYVHDGEKESVLKGHKASVFTNGKKHEYEYPDIASEKDKIYTIDTTSGNASEMKLSYSKGVYGDILYTIYDSDMNEISKEQTGLNIPAQSGEAYYVSVSVFWGIEKENVNMLYYFLVKT